MSLSTTPSLVEIAKLPDGYGRVVTLCEFKGHLVCAAENGVFTLKRNAFGIWRLRRITPLARVRWWQFWRRA